MRTLLFLFLTVFIIRFGQAQQQRAVEKVQLLLMPTSQMIPQTETKVATIQIAARFYKVKNGRIKQALLFTPLYQKTLMA